MSDEENQETPLLRGWNQQMSDIFAWKNGWNDYQIIELFDNKFSSNWQINWSTLYLNNSLHYKPVTNSNICIL